MTTSKGRGFGVLFSCLLGYMWDGVHHDQSLQRFSSDGSYSLWFCRGSVFINIYDFFHSFCLLNEWPPLKIPLIYKSKTKCLQYPFKANHGLWLCFLYCLCFVKERRIWSKTFCCIIWELTKLEIPSFSEIFTNPNKTEQNCNQGKMTWLQMATFSRQIHEDSRIKAVVKSS